MYGMLNMTGECRCAMFIALETQRYEWKKDALLQCFTFYVQILVIICIEPSRALQCANSGAGSRA